MRKFDLVIPAYNEADNLQLLIDRVLEAATSAGYSSEEFHLVLVENGSTDNSAQVLNELLKQEKYKNWLKPVRVAQNQGYGYGIWQGLSATSAKYVGWTHADMQCDPLDTFKALDIIEKSGNPKLLIKGVRSGRNWKDCFVTKVFETLSRFILGLEANEVNAQPKVFKRDLLDEVKNPPMTFAFDLYILYVAQKNGFQIQNIDVLFPPRLHGASKWAASFLGRYKTILGMILYMWHLRRSEGRL